MTSVWILVDEMFTPVDVLFVFRAIELLQYLSHPERDNYDLITRIGCTHIAITVDNIDNMYKILATSSVSLL